MEYVYPKYFYEFACTGSECPDTCCQAWEIGIDAVTLEKYRKYPGFFGNRLKNSIDWKRGTFEQYNGKCAFLNDENLCDIYTEAGKHMLCKACTRYPRHYEEYENLREISLSLSCPVAARLMLGKTEPLRFIRSYRETPEEEYEQFDLFLFARLKRIRRLFYEIIQERSLSVEVRLGMILAMSHDLQARIDRRQLCEVDALLEKYQNPVFLRKAVKKVTDCEGKTEKRQIWMAGLLKEMRRLVPLRANWMEELKEKQRILYADHSTEEYEALCAEFADHMKDRQTEYEQLLMYLVFLYLNGAVYDHDLYGKMQFCTVFFLMVRELGMSEWLIQDKKFTLDDQARVCSRFSREIEHQETNLQMLEMMICDEKRFLLDEILKAI